MAVPPLVRIVRLRTKKKKTRNERTQDVGRALGDDGNGAAKTLDAGKQSAAKIKTRMRSFGFARIRRLLIAFGAAKPKLNNTWISELQNFDKMNSTCTCEGSLLRRASTLRTISQHTRASLSLAPCPRHTLHPSPPPPPAPPPTKPQGRRVCTRSRRRPRFLRSSARTSAQHTTRRSWAAQCTWRSATAV